MIQTGSHLKVSDISGVKFVYCIQILGASYKKSACIGDIIVVVIKKRNFTASFLRKEHIRRKYNTGTIHRALIIRTKYPYTKLNHIVVKFSENAVILVNKLGTPISNWVKGPILIDMVYKYSALGAICDDLI